VHIVSGYLAPSGAREVCHHFADDEDFSILHCLELHELEVNPWRLADPHLNLISSLTSAKIEKIIFTHSPAFKLSVGHPYPGETRRHFGQFGRGIEV
jgi:hypothetical protein